MGFAGAATGFAAAGAAGFTSTRGSFFEGVGVAMGAIFPKLSRAEGAVGLAVREGAAVVPFVVGLFVVGVFAMGVRSVGWGRLVAAGCCIPCKWLESVDSDACSVFGRFSDCIGPVKPCSVFFRWSAKPRPPLAERYDPPLKHLLQRALFQHQSSVPGYFACASGCITFGLGGG